MNADDMRFDLLSDRHRVRFARWARSIPPRTQRMVAGVLTDVVGLLRNEGFLAVDYGLKDPEWTIDAGEIRLERVLGEDLDFLLISFGRDGAMRFAVRFGRRKAEPPHEWVRGGELVHRQGQRNIFWGKPGYVPRALWSDAAVAKTVDAVRARVPQIVEFLDSGVAGPNVTAHAVRPRGAGNP